MEKRTKKQKLLSKRTYEDGQEKLRQSIFSYDGSSFMDYSSSVIITLLTMYDRHNSDGRTSMCYKSDFEPEACERTFNAIIIPSVLWAVVPRYEWPVTVLVVVNWME